MPEGEFGLLPFSHMRTELRTPSFYRDVFCEIMISFILLYVDTMVLSESHEIFTIGFVCGLYVFLLIEAFGHVQGALQNPVVTLSFVYTKRLSVLKGILYIVAQILGGSTGCAAAKANMTPAGAARVAAFAPGPDVTNIQAIVSDGVITAGLIFVTLGALDERKRNLYMPGFPIGLALSLGIISAGPISGGVMNPCIATSLAINSLTFDKLWIYWTGNYLGGIIAIFLYWFYTTELGIFAPRKDRTCSLSEKSDTTPDNADGSTVNVCVNDAAFVDDTAP